MKCYFHDVELFENCFRNLFNSFIYLFFLAKLMKGEKFNLF